MPKKKAPNLSNYLPKDKGKYIGGIGPSGAKLAICGQGPAEGELEKGRPFAYTSDKHGKAAKLLKELLHEAEIEIDDCYLTNVIKYRIPGNDISRIDEIGLDIKVCQNQLFDELREVKPNLVIALGDDALKALTGKKGITKMRGSVFQALYSDFKVIGTIHTSAILRAENPYLNSDDGGGVKAQRVVTREVVIADFIKAKKESLNKEFSTPKRYIEIITDSHKLYRFIQSYKDETEPSIDIETHKCIPVCIAIAFTPWHVGVVPLMPISGSKGELRLTTTEYYLLYRELSEFLNNPKYKFVGQNIKFDLEKLIAPSKLLHPYCKDRVAADIQLMMGVAYPEFPKALEFTTSIFTNEPYYKSEGREFNPKKDPYEVLLNYNGKDGCVQKEIHLKLNEELKETVSPGGQSLYDFYYGYVNQLTDFYMEMEAEGLLVNKERRDELVSEYQRELIRVHQENVEILGTDYNAKSYTKDLPFIITKILKLPSRTGYGEEELVALLGNHTEPGSKEAKVIRNILSERQIHTNFNYLEAAYDADGFMRTSWNIAGTETGRCSTSNLKPPLRPFKGKPHQIGLAFNTLPKHGPFARRIRSIFDAEPGWVFLERDYSQAEARIVALLSDDLELIKLFDTIDVHSMTAGWFFSKDPKDITEDERFIGKAGRHAGAYGEGKNKLMKTVNADALKFGIPVQLSEAQANSIVNTFHKKSPKIRKVFQSSVREIVHRDRVLWNPFGRIRQFFGYLKDTEAYAQIPQSTVPDQLRMSGLKMKKAYPELRFTMDMHDAFVWKIREDKIDKYLKITKEFMETEIDFKYCSIPRGKMIIPTEAKIGKNLADLKKVKE